MENKNDSTSSTLFFKNVNIYLLITLVFCFLVNQRGYLDHSVTTENDTPESFMCAMFDCSFVCSLSYDGGLLSFGSDSRYMGCLLEDKKETEPVSCFC